VKLAWASGAGSALGQTRFPDAMQRAAVYRQSGIVTYEEFATVPDLRRITPCCAAPGKCPQLASWRRCVSAGTSVLFFKRRPASSPA
jgi:hypothetical protein